MGDYFSDNSSKLGFAGGLILSTAVQLDLAEVMESLILGFTGAVASFVGTVVCRSVYQKFKAFRDKEER